LAKFERSSKNGLQTESDEEVGYMPVSDLVICPECGVPEQMVESYIWLNSGVMVAKTDQAQRLILVESENLDPLFEGISEVIGLPIERQVIDVCRRGTANFVKDMVPREVKDLIIKREIDLEPIIIGLTDVMMTTSQVMGFGKFEFMGYRYEQDENDYLTNRCAHPYSVPLSRGNLAGTIEGLYDTEATVESREVAPDVYEQTAHFGRHSKALEERLKLTPYRHREGDVELARCSSCGGPTALTSFEWIPEDGIIRSKSTGRRLAVVSPYVLEAVFDELEVEVGETMPRAIVEAQRRFIKSSSYSIDEISDEEEFRTQLAVRGCGNLRNIHVGKDGISLRIDNAATHLMVVGMVQGLFEAAFDVESNVEWNISEDRDLEVNVTPKGA
jgi:hypothetical protein